MNGDSVVLGTNLGLKFEGLAFKNKIKNLANPVEISAREKEAKLIAKIKNGDELAYVQLVNKFSEKLFNKAYSMVSSPEDAQDILQEAMLSAFKAFPNFRAESGVYTWLYRIVVNKAKDHLNRRRVKKENLVDTQEIQIEDDRIDYQSNLEKDEDSKFLLEQINSLEGMYRDILIMRYFDECSYQELSELLSINIGTVKSRLFKAKSILKNQIKKAGKGGGFAL